MIIKSFAYFLIAILLFTLSNFSFAQQEKKKIPIPTLFNTGVDNFKQPLADGESDPHYLIVQSADAMFPGPESKVVFSNAFPMDCWIQNDNNSKWIAPRADAGEFNSAGMYAYTLTFSLNGFKPETAEVRGMWTSDNNGADILINNANTGFETPYNAFTFGFFPFEIKKGFIKGINTITFLVYNGEAPTGLRVVISGEAEPIDVAGK